VLTRQQLAAALGVAPNTVKQWTTDGTLPPTAYVLSGRGSQSAYMYSPRALMIGQLVLELGDVFGSDNSPLPKRIAKQLVNELDRAEWRESLARLTVTCGSFTFTADLKFMQTAKRKLAAFDAA